MLQQHAPPTHITPPLYLFPFGNGSLPCQRPSSNPLAIGCWAGGSIVTAPSLEVTLAPCAHTAILLLHTTSRGRRGRRWGRTGRRGRRRRRSRRRGWRWGRGPRPQFQDEEAPWDGAHDDASAR